MSSRPSNSMDPDGVRSRCVILVSPGEAPPQPLLDLVRDQTQDARHIVRADHPLLALAHLATLERARLMRQDTLEDWPPRSPEKSILVVVNREAWRDLAPLFTTIRELMPAAGIWVCTERIAIEIYAGDGEAGLTEATDLPPTAPAGSSLDAAPTLDPPPSDDSVEEIEASALTDAELRDLLDLYDMFDDADGSTFPDAGDPHTS